MTNERSRDLEDRFTRARFRAAASTLASLLLLAVAGAGCIRSDPPSAPKAGSSSAAVTAGGTDCVALTKTLAYKFESANYWGSELNALKDQHDMQACARACSENKDCKVATYVDSTGQGGWANTCVLRSAVGERHPGEAGTCSWVKNP